MPLFGLLTIGLPLWAGGCATVGRSAPVQVEAWYELSTEHFALATELPRDQAEEVIRQLEGYLSALVDTEFAGLPAPKQSISIVAFGTGAALHRYIGSIWQGIYFNDVLGAPLIVAGGSDDGFYDGTARHELAHYVADLAFHHRRLPLWFAEGNASLLETVAYDRRRHEILFGRAALGRVQDLKKRGLLPAADILEGKMDQNDKASAERFYASSWLLVHCLTSRHGAAMQVYQRLLLNGAPSEEAWTRALPAELRAGLDAELARYLATHAYEVSWRRPWQAPEVVVSARSLSPADVTATMALVTVAAGQESHKPPAEWRESALALVAQALAADPGNARALRIKRSLAPDDDAGDTRDARDTGGVRTHE